MIKKPDFLWWEGLDADLAMYWHRKLMEKEIPADFQLIHRGFDAITGLGPAPTLYRVVISTEHLPIAMVALTPLIILPEDEDAIYQLSPLGLWAWKEGWVRIDGVTRTLAFALWNRMFGASKVLGEGKPISPL